MFEYVAFNPYNASPEAMANELTKKSSEGWEVVQILPTFDGRYCAFLRRPVSAVSNLNAGSTTSINQENSVNVDLTTAVSNSSVPAA